MVKLRKLQSRLRDRTRGEVEGGPYLPKIKPGSKMHKRTYPGSMNGRKVS